MFYCTGVDVFYCTGVDVHWCACASHYRVPDGHIDKEKMSSQILTELNQKTADHRHLCAAYTEIQVLNVTRLVPNEEVGLSSTRVPGLQMCVQCLPTHE